MIQGTEEALAETRQQPGRPQAHRYLWIAGACTVAMALAYILGRYGIEVPKRIFLQLHLVLEFSSIVVSFAVFTTGWYGYRQSKDPRDLVVGATFMMTGVIDFVHTLTYNGMPDFLGPNSVGKAAAYWMLARLIAGLGLLTASSLSPKAKNGCLSPISLVAVSVAIIVTAASLFTIHGQAVGKAFYDPENGGLTHLKIWLGYATMLIYAGAFLAITESRGWPRKTVVFLRGALIIAIYAEFAFTLYISPYDLINALGHVFKTAAYFLILNALFVTAMQRPYGQLASAKDELQEMYADAQEHRKEIERSFAHIGSALSSSLKLDEALDRIAELAVDMLHADCSVVASVDRKTNTIQVAAQRGGCHAEHRPVELSLVVGKRAAEERRSIIENDLEATGMVQCDYSHADCLRSMLCAPMMHDGASLGMITIFSHSKGAFEEGDAKLLEAFAMHAAVATHNAISYERESRIADVLQKTFLNSNKIVTDRFEIAQVYQPAMNEALVGGDFYDTIELPGGKIGLVIGDVSGKGLAAAIHTAMAKYTLRAFMGEGHSPAKAIELLDRALFDLTSDDAFITMFFGLLDGNTGELTYVNAGHEPPIYSRDGTFITLPSTGPALGLGIAKRFEEGNITLEKGGVLLLYTDGVSEARQGRTFLGTERIGELLVRCEGIDSDNVAKCVHESALEFAGGELRDDAAILAVRAL